MPDPTREEMIEALRIEVDRTEGIIDTLKTLASGALSPFPIDTTRDEAHLAALRAVLRELEAGGWRPTDDAAVPHADLLPFPKEALSTQPSAADVVRAGEADNDLVHDILNEAQEACGIYHTTAGGKMRRALTAARREERELRALDEAVIAEAHKTVQQVGATQGLIDALAARDAAIKEKADD